MISINIEFNDNNYYKYSDKEFVDNAGMKKISEGKYISSNDSDNNALIWSSYDGIVSLFKNKWFKDKTKLFTRDIDGEEENLFDCYEYMKKENLIY